MIVEIFNKDEITKLVDLLGTSGKWVDGRTTAGKKSGRVKNTLVFKFNDPGSESNFLNQVSTGLRNSKKIENFCFIKDIFSMRISKMSAGHYYGLHSDIIVTENFRADISFTLFLSNPEDYQGGELCVLLNGEWEKIKLPMGSVFLYPAGTCHKVEEVQSGERLILRGLIQSNIKNHQHREILSMLSVCTNKLFDDQYDMETTQQVNQCVNNLKRLWHD